MALFYHYIDTCTVLYLSVTHNCAHTSLFTAGDRSRSPLLHALLLCVLLHISAYQWTRNWWDNDVPMQKNVCESPLARSRCSATSSCAHENGSPLPFGASSAQQKSGLRRFSRNTSASCNRRNSGTPYLSTSAARHTSSDERVA